MVRLWMESRLWLAVTLSRLWLACISPTKVLGVRRVVDDHRGREKRRLRFCLVGRLWLAPRGA